MSDVISEVVFWAILAHVGPRCYAKAFCWSFPWKL